MARKKLRALPHAFCDPERLTILTGGAATMTITLDIKPELEAELAAQAAARGMDVPAYVATLLEQAAQPAEQPKRKQTLVEFFQESPLFGVELDLERDKDTGRDIEL
jgi:hypothetical protein